jgi:DNA-binding response OmpR family regulator
MIQLLVVRSVEARNHDIVGRFQSVAENHWHIQIQRLPPMASPIDLNGNHPPDVMITDLVHAGSPDTLRRVRCAADDSWGRSPRIPILALVQAQHLVNSDWHRDADDFQCAPYDPREMTARVNALLRHRIHGTAASGLIQLPGTRIHTDHCTAETDDGQTVPLTAREFELLAFFARNRGRFFDRRLLIERVWGADFCGGERTVDVHIRRLRSKLPVSTAVLLETRHGFGYGFRAS